MIASRYLRLRSPDGGFLSGTVFRIVNVPLTFPGRPGSRNRSQPVCHLKPPSRTYATKKSKQSADLHQLTLTQIQKTWELLQKGYQPWEIALHLGRSRTDLEAALEADTELASMQKGVKTGPWSDLEDDYLIRLIQNRRILDKNSIAHQIGRKKNSVAARLSAMAKEYGTSDVVPFSEEFLDSDLGHEERAVLEQRMCRIIEGLLGQGMTRQWEDVLAAKSVQDWALALLPLVPIRVKHVLAAPRAPTAMDWGNLAWQDTTSMGVYAWILKPRYVHPLRLENFVYIGSATKYGWGLTGRRLQHRRGKEGSNFLLQSRIKGSGLSRAGPFVTLLSKEAMSPESKDVVEARYLVVFAEAIFTIWLGALTGGNSANSEERFHLRSLCPWDVYGTTYNGLCSHNPLTKDISLPFDPAQQVLKEE
ncbi:hypothetical protein B0T25DRAFT_568888 [Lasiosphaeria hispida]|uniref:Uncharacterized protein n=1 Tax=Lasiosphaeria hispida TaxID=260671 RepID=A0AAJ0HJE8_9PEZI|nr:hypothetical protein B0T25DRAFT_568888 [Lasiosphaeria hispida]